MRTIILGLLCCPILVPALLADPGSGAPPDLSSTPPADADTLHFMDEITVTATPFVRDLFSVSRSVSVVTAEQIRGKNQPSILDAFDDRIGIWIEKRTGTTSDPVLRGLSGGNVLATMDGASLTTFWGEGGFAGDDLYGKIDGESVERVEIVRGPSAALYGSNALGGVLNFIPKSPPLEVGRTGLRFGGRIKSAYGSAAKYRLLRLEQWGGTGRLRYLTGLSIHRMDDVRVGAEEGRITPSGGKDLNFDARADIEVGQDRLLTLGIQSVHRPEVYRSYRPTQVNRNERLGVSACYRGDIRLPIADTVTLNGNYQNKRDEREWLGQSKEGFATWRSYAFGLQSLKVTSTANLFTWGLQYRADIAESPDDEQFTVTTPATGEQQASPGTYWGNVGAYVLDELRLWQRFAFTGSLRFDQHHFSADDDVFYTVPGSTAPENVPTRDPGTYDRTSLTGGVGVLFAATAHWSLVSSWHRGYRLFAPNFGLRQLGYGLLAPNGLLDPITGDTYELSLRGRRHRAAASLTAYYTDFDNFQQPWPGSYEGKTALDFDGSGTIEPDESVYVVRPNGSAYVQGLEIEGELELDCLSTTLRDLTLSGGLMWNYGREKYPGNQEAPLRHTHPLRGIIRLRWTGAGPHAGSWLELTADLVGKFDQISADRLLGDVGYRSDPQDPSSPLIRDYGLPGYAVFDLRGGMDLFRRARLVIALENMLDKNYRAAHSRMDAMGRNLQVGLEYEF